jgi:hypothetical protein
MIKILTPVKLLGLFCLVCCSYKASAQSKTDTTGKPDFKIGFSFINNDVFYGRSDTIKTPTIIPLIKYTFGSGIYLAGDLNIVTNRKNNKLDGGSLTAGYEFAPVDDMEGEVSFSKIFYNGNSTQVNSSNRANFNGSLNYNIADIITPSIAFDYDLNRSGVGNDAYINFGLSHDFELGDFTISPTAEFNAGTQNFYDDYIVRRATRFKKAATTQNAILAADKVELSQFKLLDYEFSLPVVYDAGHAIVSFTPSYALAQNKLPATISSALSSSGSIFYFQLGISLKF